MLIANLLFYILAFALVTSAILVISVRNPIHSVLFLILAFFNSAGIFLMLGAEFISMLIIIVYVGAVSVLFLFVVMMLDIDFSQLSKGFIKHWPTALGVSIIMLAEIILVLYVSTQEMSKNIEIQSPIDASVTNTKAIGAILYTDYIYPFQISGLILLVAMIGAITLTLRVRTGVRKQKISKQLSRQRKDAVELVKVQSSMGV